MTCTAAPHTPQYLLHFHLAFSVFAANNTTQVSLGTLLPIIFISLPFFLTGCGSVGPVLSTQVLASSGWPHLAFPLVCTTTILLCRLHPFVFNWCWTNYHYTLRFFQCYPSAQYFISPFLFPTIVISLARPSIHYSLPYFVKRVLSLPPLSCSTASLSFPFYCSFVYRVEDEDARRSINARGVLTQRNVLRTLKMRPNYGPPLLG